MYIWKTSFGGVGGRCNESEQLGGKILERRAIIYSGGIYSCSCIWPRALFWGEYKYLLFQNKVVGLIGEKSGRENLPDHLP